MKRLRAGRFGRARGVTLAELMVSMTLGLLVALVGSALLLSASGSYLNQGEAARLGDGGRFALESIGRALRQSAFVNWDGAEALVGERPEDSANIGGLDARSVSRDSDGIATPLGDAVNGSDVLAVRYFGAGPGPNGDGSMSNCAGFGVGKAATEAERGWSIFYVGRDASGEAELRCKYRSAAGWGADAIVRGVDTFQVLYGLDTDFDGVANQYVNASTINAMDAGLVLSGTDAAARERERNRKTYWKRVVSVKLALLLHGERGSSPDSLPAQFDLFGKPYTDAYGGSDPGVLIDERSLPAAMRGRVRHAVVTTIALRNRPK
ncbi:type IV pilus assembly protein PilW [Oxalobacteraceae bacterium GrIS 1.11]